MDLNAVRERINAIDDRIVDLFVERMKASADVASAKAEKNLPVLDLRLSGRGGLLCGKSMRQIVCIAQQDVFQQLRECIQCGGIRSVQIWRAAHRKQLRRLCNRGL